MNIGFLRIARNLCLAGATFCTGAFVLGQAILANARHSYTHRPTQPKHQRPKVDWKFIQKLEGGNRLHGYIPKNPRNGKVIGHSGVTIAAGYDIGQHSQADINNLKISPELKRKLYPYAGLKKGNADRFLAEHPLTITPQESQELNNAVHQQELEKIQEKYNSHAKSPKDNFTNLPPPAQTAVASIGHQNGNPEKHKFHGVMKDVHKRHFAAAANDLRHVHDKYPTRHRAEAAELAQAAHKPKGPPTPSNDKRYHPSKKDVLIASNAKRP